MATAAGRFESKVDRSGEHHLWTGAVSQRGIGQVRIEGKLLTATRVAWVLANGEPPNGAKVLACPGEPKCVNVHHLRLDVDRNAISIADSSHRVTRGSGRVTETGRNTWKIGVSVGLDETGQRRRVFRTVHGTRTDAVKALAVFSVEVADGSSLPLRSNQDLTVDQLVNWYLDFAKQDRGLEHSTLIGYADVYANWIKGPIGGTRAARLRVADIDRTFGHMRRAGLSYSRMNNARAVLSGAFRWGKRHQMVSSNPLDGFEIPRSQRAPKVTAAPELADLLRLLDGADEHNTELAPILKLGATTGMRRGELAGLRRDRLRLGRFELVVDSAVNDAGGVVVQKTTKTSRSRVVSVDEATAALLAAHLTAMDDRARLVGVTIAADGFVFSLEPDCSLPMRPEFMTRRARVLRKTLGIEPGDFDATILALRKWTSSELMDSGFNPSTVSSRQGHTVQVMLHHYSSARKSADRAAAEHLGERVHGNRGEPDLQASAQENHPRETRAT